MKQILTIAILVLAVAPICQAKLVYYCHLENLPSVQKGLESELERFRSEREGIEGDIPLENNGQPTTVAVGGMGDAFDYWGTSLVIYKISPEVGFLFDLAIVLKVKYTSFMASEAAGEIEEDGKVICQDTGEVNADEVFIEGDGESVQPSEVTVIRY